MSVNRRRSRERANTERGQRSSSWRGRAPEDNPEEGKPTRNAERKKKKSVTRAQGGGSGWTGHHGAIRQVMREPTKHQENGFGCAKPIVTGKEDTLGWPASTFKRRKERIRHV